MRPLQENYKIFVLLNICPPANSISHWKKLFHILVSISCLSILFIGMLASLAFILKYFSDDLESAICACDQIVGGMTVFYPLIIAHIKRDDFKEIFDSFQAFYNTSKYNISICTHETIC